jgi:hypothetical protein
MQECALMSSMKACIAICNLCLEIALLVVSAIFIDCLAHRSYGCIITRICKPCVYMCVCLCVCWMSNVFHLSQSLASSQPHTDLSNRHFPNGHTIIKRLFFFDYIASVRWKESFFVRDVQVTCTGCSAKKTLTNIFFRSH